MTTARGLHRITGFEGLNAKIDALYHEIALVDKRILSKPQWGGASTALYEERNRLYSEIAAIRRPFDA